MSEIYISTYANGKKTITVDGKVYNVIETSECEMDFSFNVDDTKIPINCITFQCE